MSGHLNPTESYSIHHPCVFGTVWISLWLPLDANTPAAGHNDVRMRGKFSLPAPQERTKDSYTCTLHPPDGGSVSPQLNILVLSGLGGAFTMKLSAPHWLRNNSSLALRLYDAGLTTNLGHVTQAAAKAAEAIPFSLPEQGSSVSLVPHRRSRWD